MSILSTQPSRNLEVQSAIGPIRRESLLRGDGQTKAGKIMIVDDEPINIKIVRSHLSTAGYDSFVTTDDSREAMNLIRGEDPDVVILDVMMPHVSGLNILEAVRSDLQYHRLPVLILTAAEDEETERIALDLGATDFLPKPVTPAQLLPRVRNALVVKAHDDHTASYSARLEAEVAQRTAALHLSRQELIHVLACAAEYRDNETGNHVIRVGLYTKAIASQLGISPQRVELISQAAILHDVGKIGISDKILLKQGKLTAEEIATMQRHCQFGANILQGIPSDGESKLSSTMKSAIATRLAESPILKVAATIAISHHEKWDGSGYPRGLSGEAIPIEGRITAVADVFDALSSRRPYKEPLPIRSCFEILEEGRGTHFDPRVLNAFYKRAEEAVAICREFGDV